MADSLTSRDMERVQAAGRAASLYLATECGGDIHATITAASLVLAAVISVACRASPTPGAADKALTAIDAYVRGALAKQGIEVTPPPSTLGEMLAAAGLAKEPN